MINWKSFFFLLICVTSSWAFAETDWTEQSIPVTPGSEMQTQIDNAVIEIFNSPIGQELCGVYKTAQSWYSSVGISPAVAMDFAKRCPSQLDDPAKSVQKKYYLSFKKHTSLDSWTDFGNNTYIFVNDGLTHQRLKSILLHEIAISTDSKARILYPSYTGLLAASGQRVNNSNEYQNTLRQAFNYASWGPISRTFATIRAYEFEAISEGLNPIAEDHEQCTKTVLALLPIVKSLPTPPKAQGQDEVATILSMVEDFEKANDQNVAPKSPEHEKSILQFLLASTLTLKDIDNKKVTFCQFMTHPLLTNRSQYSLMGAGPRPRLTGGSGGQGRSNDESYIDNVLAEFEQSKNKMPSESLQDQQLKNAIEKMKIAIPADKMKFDNKGKILLNEAPSLEAPSSLKSYK